jgi:preprotein translocase subunit SecA
MDHLKEGIGLRGYGQQDPLVAYKKESFEMFEAMMTKFQEDTVRHLFRMQILGPDGTPIETREQLATLQAGQRGSAPAAAPVTLNASAQQLGQESFPTEPPASHLLSEPTHIPVAPSIDALEREFEQRKERELAAARSNGSGATADNSPRTATPTPGRNEECFCGSGKKYKKCHGATA